MGVGRKGAGKANDLFCVLGDIIAVINRKTGVRLHQRRPAPLNGIVGNHWRTVVHLDAVSAASGNHVAAHRRGTSFDINTIATVYIIDYGIS